MTDTYDKVTICFSLPRSRSQWLAWLYLKAIDSWHDPLKFCRHPLDLARLIDDTGGNRPLFIADTAAIFFHDQIVRSLPGVRRIYVKRNVTEVTGSLILAGATPDLGQTQTLLHGAKLLDRHTSNPMQHGWAWIHYDHLDYFALTQWPKITGGMEVPRHWHNLVETHIDVPLHKQARYPARTAELFKHMEQ